MRERTEKVMVTVLKTASTYSREGDNLRPPSGDKYKDGKVQLLPSGRVFYSQSASLWLISLTSSVKLFPQYQKLRYRDIYQQ